MFNNNPLMENGENLKQNIGDQPMLHRKYNFTDRNEESPFHFPLFPFLAKEGYGEAEVPYM